MKGKHFSFGLGITAVLLLALIVVTAGCSSGSNTVLTTTTSATRSSTSTISTGNIPATLTSITIQPAKPDSLWLGSVQQFKATGTYSDGSTADITSEVTWKSSDESIATISPSGEAEGVVKESLQAPPPPPGMPENNGGTSAGSSPGGAPPGGSAPGGAPAGSPPSGGPPPGGSPTPQTSVTSNVKITASLSGITSNPVTLTIVTSEGPAVYLQKGGNETRSNQNITASKTSESAVKVIDGGQYTLSDSTIKTSGNSSGLDSSSFYGLNAAVLAESGSTINLSNVNIGTTGTGANAVFAVGDGTTINLSNTKIDCKATGAHGVDATLAGKLVLNNVDITTAGDGASAAIATDRGGGTVEVNGGTVLTTGARSPALYCTGNITVNGGTFTSTGSEAAVIEGKNTLNITDADLTGSKDWGVMVYQSMSGDASVGTGNFTMTGGLLKAEEGPLFMSTNTQSVFTLKNVKLTAVSGTLLKAAAMDWGTPGSNGADVIFNADSQTMEGNIICDKISTIKATLTNGAVLNGTVNTENTAKLISLSLDNTSTWEVTGTSYLTIFADGDSTLSNIHSNGNTIYYDSSNSANSWLGGKTINLTGGGKLIPD